MLLTFLSLFFVLMCIHFFSVRNTIFAFSLKNANLSGILIIKEIYLYVVLGVFLFEIMGVSAFTTFFVTDESAKQTGLIIFYAISLLFLSIGFFSKFVFKKYLVINSIDFSNKITNININLLLFILAAMIFLLLIIFNFFNLRHAFLTSILSGESLINVRLANRYSGIPTVLISFYNFLVLIFIVLIGYYRSSLSRLMVFLSVLLLLLFTSFFGGKAPILDAFIIYTVSTLNKSTNLRFNIRLVSKILVLIAASVVALFYIVKIQYPDLELNSFFQYLIGRIGIGQIHGVYEQFVLQLNDSSYIYHTIPFANFFMDYNVFNKDLMMNTWGMYRSSAEETGVMNSLFIGEALAIGGYLLVFLSPVIVAFNYCFLAFFVVFFFHKFFSFPINDSKKLGGLIVVSFILFTGDITGLLLFKSFFMLAIFLMLVFLGYRFFRLISTSSRVVDNCS